METTYIRKACHVAVLEVLWKNFLGKSLFNQQKESLAILTPGGELVIQHNIHQHPKFTKKGWDCCGFVIYAGY